MVVIVFRARVRPDAELAVLERHGRRMHALATAMPGFIGYKEFASADGESLTLIHFEDEESLQAWRRHPEHVEVQQAGREHFFSWYDITVGEVARHYAFPPDGSGSHS